MKSLSRTVPIHIICKLAKSYFIILLIGLNWVACRSKNFVSEDIQSEVVPINAQINANAHPASLMIKPYKKAMDSLMGMPVAKATMPFTKTLPESTLGNLITDLIRGHFEKTSGVKIQALILNQGGLRIELPQGIITRSMVFELMPFDNELVLLNMKGSDLRVVLNHIAEKGGMPVSGLRMGISEKKAVDIEIAGRAINDDQDYRIATSDYLYNGGDKFNFSNATQVNNTGLKVRDLILDAFIEIDRQGLQLQSTLDGRIYNVQ
jgi:2',3'-cyclic-nucleotide 2'-phosphodiesterase (5'-nucleotidase family)